MESFNAVEAASASPFPTRTRQAAASVSGVVTEINSVQFIDKIVLTISQNGKIGHWVHVPLTNPNPHVDEIAGPSSVGLENDDSGSFPLPYLTATSILGASKDDREIAGQLFATQIASAICGKHPGEKRLLVVGMGFMKDSLSDRDTFMQLLELSLGCVG